MSLEYYISKIIKKLHFRAIKNSTIHKTAGICAGTQVVNSQVGKYTDIGYDCVIINANLGAFCSLGMGIHIGGASHPMEWVSTSTTFCENKDHIKKKFAHHIYNDTRLTLIGNDVWIADGVFIKAGIHIADGAVIGMGSVVTKDVGPYEIWAGNPAKYIRKRFDDSTVERVHESKWWDATDEEIEDMAYYFNVVDKYLDKKVRK